MYEPLGQGSTWHIHWAAHVAHILDQNARNHATLVARESRGAVTLRTFMEGQTPSPIHYPANPPELWRCFYVLKEYPEYRARMPEIASLCPQWRLLSQYWEPLEKLCRSEWPDYDAPKTAKKMKNMLASVK